MTYSVLCSDVLQALPTLDTFELVFADAPFNIGVKYASYSDNLSQAEYVRWCVQWISEAWQHTHGVLCLHGPDDLAEIYLYAARQLGFGQHRISWVNPFYDFGQCGRSNWVDARCHCLIFGRPPGVLPPHPSRDAIEGPGRPATGYKWRPERVLRPSARASVYGDPRVHDTPNGGMRLPGTVWGVPSDGPYWGRVQVNNKERRPLHPNQLPEVYLERLILAYTDEGDSVLDLFSGSGTCATVANGLSRNVVAVELSEKYCESIETRIKGGMVR